MNTFFVSVFFTFIFFGCNGEVLFRTKPCEEGTVRQGSACVSDQTGSKSSDSSCKDPDLNKLQKGETITLCDGSLGEGKLIDCSKDGEQDCVAKSKFKVVDSTNISASDIKNGKVIAGITGTKRDIKQCRNASNLAYYDISLVDESKKLFSRISSAPGGNAVQLSWNHGLVANDPIQLFCLGGTGTVLAGGAVNTNTTYYAGIVTTDRIQFLSSPSGSVLSVTGTTGCTGGSWFVGSPSDGVAQLEDTIDDYNGMLSVTTAPSNSPWSSDYVCNESNFKNVSGAAPLAPSNTTPTNANKVWSQIWRDELTGLLLTNVLGSNTNFKDWYQINAMCKSLDNLNGGSGGSGWRLPTQKELMQLYIDGIAKVPLAGATLDDYVWTSTGGSDGVWNVWTMFLAQGLTQTPYRHTTFPYLSICVR